jgi:hypothetical protein
VSVNLGGYITNKALTSWKGVDSGWRLHRVVGTYTVAPEYDTTYAVILTKRGKATDAWAAGYWLGEGSLFRGEKIGSAKHGSRAEAGLVHDAREQAKSLSEYWGQRDDEAREEDEAKQREEDGSSPRRRRKPTKRTRR